MKDSLTQAHAEGLISEDALETGDADVQIAGPSLALFFAALGSVGTPPSISAPDGSFSLTSANCPLSFKSVFAVWQSQVPTIQRLSSEARHDLALLLCDKDPLSSPLLSSIVQLSGEIKAIAIEITQRRTFQLRFASDIQHALNAEVKPRKSGESERSTGYRPPPGYAKDEEETLEVPEILDNLAVIRETLYSALADCIVSTPSIGTLISRGPEWASRAFFASTCLAILEVCLTRVDRNGVRVVHLGRNSPKVIGLNETPVYLRPFLTKLVEVSEAAKSISEEDDQRAIQEAIEGSVTSEPRLGRLRVRLESGLGDADETARAASVEHSVTNLANAINALSLEMATLPAFRERQAEVFKILASVTSF